MRLLIAVVSCHKFRERADLLRHVWVPDVRDADVRFFLGRGHGEPKPDEVWLDVADDYRSLRQKVQTVFGWAVAQGYDAVFKTDDDVLVLPDRLVKIFVRRDYVGRVRGPSRENDAPRIYGPNESSFCSGFGYWLSRKAAGIVAEAPDNGDWAEDRYVGNVLARSGIRPVHDDTILLWPPLQGHYCHVPNGRCRSCVAQYAGASVLCPHQRPEVIPKLYDSYKKTSFIPTHIPR